MSLPRDLKVEIPGHGTDKINAAYALGGPQADARRPSSSSPACRSTTSSTSTSAASAEAVNAIGCVYADIDRRYLQRHAPSTRYINVPPGYQKCAATRRSSTCASATRTPTSCAAPASRTSCARPSSRSAIGAADRRPRQADRDLRQVTRSSDIGAAVDAEVLRLLKLAVGSADQPIREVHFEGASGASYVDGEPATQVRRSSRSSSSASRRRRARAARSSRRPARKRKQRRELADLEDVTDGAARTRRCRRSQKGAGGELPGLLPDACARRGLVLHQAAARLQDQGPRRQALPRLPDGAHSAAGCSASTTASRAPPGRTRRSSRARTEKRKIGRRTYELHYDGDRAAAGRLADPEGRLLGLEHPAADAVASSQMLAIARSSARSRGSLASPPHD